MSERLRQMTQERGPADDAAIGREMRANPALRRIAQVTVAALDKARAAEREVAALRAEMALVAEDGGPSNDRLNEFADRLLLLAEAIEHMRTVCNRIPDAMAAAINAGQAETRAEFEARITALERRAPGDGLGV